MPSTTQSTQFDTLTPIQVQVLQSLVAGLSVTAAAKEAGIHRTTVHLWTRTLPDFVRAYLTLRQQRARPPLGRTRRSGRPRHQHFSTVAERRIHLRLSSLEGRHGDR